MEDNGVIAALLDLRPISADTVSAGRHRHLNLGFKGHESDGRHMNDLISVLAAK